MAIDKQMDVVLKIPKVFRNTICKECNWTVAQYNAKMKNVNLLAEDKLPGLTYNEKRKVVKAMKIKFCMLYHMGKSILTKRYPKYE